MKGQYKNMNDIFYGHLSDTERELAIYESKYDIDMMKADLMSIYAEKMNEIKEKEAELRVLTEGGTYDDLVAYYEAEAETNNEQKQSAISAFIQAITDFIGNIITSITNLFKKPEEKANEEAAKNADGEMNIPNVTESVFKPLNKAINSFKNTFSKEPSAQEAEQTSSTITELMDIASSNLEHVLNISIYAAGVGAGQKIVDKGLTFIKVPAKDVAGKIKSMFGDGLKSITDWISTLASVKKPSDENTAKWYDGIMKRLNEFVQGFSKIPQGISDIIKHIANKSGKKTDAGTDQNSADANGGDAKANDSTGDKAQSDTKVNDASTDGSSAKNDSGAPQGSDASKNNTGNGADSSANKNNAGAPQGQPQGSDAQQPQKPDNQQTKPTAHQPQKPANQQAKPTAQQTPKPDNTEKIKELEKKIQYKQADINKAVTDADKQKLRDEMKDLKDQLTSLKTTSTVTQSENPSATRLEEESAFDDIFADLDGFFASI